MKATNPIKPTIIHTLRWGAAAILASLVSLPAIAADWPMLGGSASRNAVSPEKDGPTDWDVTSGRNIKWIANLGSKSLGTPIVSGGIVFAGTNNEAHRDPANASDGGVEMAFDEATGKFLWQKLYPKLPTGRETDWPGDGFHASAYGEPGRVWYCTNTCHVVCLDMAPGAQKLADGSPPVVWDFDMIGKLGVYPFRRTPCSPVSYRGKLYVITGNGRGDHHRRVMAPEAPSVICFEKCTGNVVWTDNSPGKNIFSGQWSSPCIAEVGGRVLVIAALGDGWIYAYDAASGKVAWKFDCNEKSVEYPEFYASLPATPAVVGDRLYLATGFDGEMPPRNGRMWCIDMTKSGDISAELDAPNPPVDAAAPKITRKGIANPNSGAIWQASVFDANPTGKTDYARRVYSSRSTVSVSDGLVFLPDMEGYFHCFDAKTGAHRWTRNLDSCVYGSPLVVDGNVYVGDEDGNLYVFKCSPEMKTLAKHNMGAPIYSSPVYSNGVLYVMTKDKLYAIEKKGIPQ